MTIGLTQAVMQPGAIIGRGMLRVMHAPHGIAHQRRRPREPVVIAATETRPSALPRDGEMRAGIGGEARQQAKLVAEVQQMIVAGEILAAPEPLRRQLRQAIAAVGLARQEAVVERVQQFGLAMMFFFL